MKPRLVLVLGDQLSPRLSALAAADPARDLVVMAEVLDEATHVRHHPKKIILFLAAMRKFAARLRAAGWRVAYSALDDPANRQSLAGECLRRAAEAGAEALLLTRPGDWRLTEALGTLPLKVTMLPDTRFLCPEADFAAWARGRSTLRMEPFYRMMRRRTGFLMEGDEPAGGRWNFDTENRRPPAGGLFRTPPLRHEPDAVTQAVIDLVARRFGDHFGSARDFWFPTDRDQALASLGHFLRHQLPAFGPYQDAMLAGDPFLHHAVIAPALNLGLLEPREVCAAAEAEWRAGRVPIQSAEGFIRQILGWREYVRGLYDLHGPGYARQNALGHRRALPALYWGAGTGMRCLERVVAQTRDEAYAHHIQRLMVAGNFALLAGVDPWAVHEWFLSVYADAVEWVEAPNVIGMSQHADGGVMASKPYAASGAYVARMSDYCRSCHYDVKARSGPRACPFNPLYWHFLDRHRTRFEAHPRMTPVYRTWERMDPAHREAVLATAEALLARLDAGDPV